ncbi:hypothetical protein [Bdellovibrio sp.]|uniref:hypothetical protein n=1 Tax=Bdellovibrio TaxID=958 RepID=UPI003221EAD9
MKYSLAISVLSLFVLQSQSAFAKEIPVQARLFAGMTTVKPDNVNETIEAQGLKKMDGISQLGVEITYPVMKYLDVGARYAKKMASSGEELVVAADDYQARLDQDAFLLIARVPLKKSDFIRVDIFGGVGGTNTSFKVKTASLDGELKKSVGDEWYASPYAAAGASLAFGYKKFYLVLEAGYEYNKIDGFKSSGNPGSIDTLDLSGGYFTLGLMFDGVPGTVN